MSQMFVDFITIVQRSVWPNIARFISFSTIVTMAETTDLAGSW